MKNKEPMHKIEEVVSEEIKHAAICVITYLRPDGLKHLLKGLERQKFEKCTAPQISIIVVDNEREGSARSVVDEAKQNYRWTLNYFVEPRRGIPFARNTAISKIGDEVDFVVFVDDDEIPEDNWLDELLHTQSQYDADVVAGPVIPIFVEPPPSWAIDGQFFQRQRRATGDILHKASTGNVLARAELFRKFLFDERFTFTGGSDSHLFLRVGRAGYKMVWSDTAVVKEWMPPSRVKARWLLQRSYRYGVTDGMVEFSLQPSPYTKMRRFVKGFQRLSLGLGLLVFSLGSYVRFVKAAQKICHGAGWIVSVFGVRYEEYKNIHIPTPGAL